MHQDTLSIRKNKSTTQPLFSLVLLLFEDPAAVVLAEFWLVATASRREQLEVVSLRLRDSLLGALSAFLQAPPDPGKTHRLWLFSSPRQGGPFRGDSWAAERTIFNKSKRSFFSLKN